MGIFFGSQKQHFFFIGCFGKSYFGKIWICQLNSFLCFYVKNGQIAFFKVVFEIGQLLWHQAVIFPIPYI